MDNAVNFELHGEQHKKDFVVTFYWSNMKEVIPVLAENSLVAKHMALDQFYDMHDRQLINNLRVTVEERDYTQLDFM